jgi:hypothetical protein
MLAAWLSRLVRGIVLIVWILGLSLVALASLEGTLAKVILSSRESVPVVVASKFGHLADKLSPDEKVCPKGDDVLADFLYFENNAPPIAIILDDILPGWETIKKCGEARPHDVYSAYEDLFDKITVRLRSIARNENIDPKTVKIDNTSLPPAFQSLAKKTHIVVALPEVQDWVAEERIRIKDDEKARDLLNVFLLLSVLGAFGALIFLIRDYITLDEEKKISDYVFRPVLGIFLAVAVFVVDILAHSVISTSGILQIRYEPLYILALGAGLLSERVYEWIRGKADLAFRKEDANDQQQKRTVI